MKTFLTFSKEYRFFVKNFINKMNSREALSSFLKARIPFYIDSVFQNNNASNAGIQKGDKIVTSGGITGVITRVIDNDKIEVEIAENVSVEVIKGTGVQSLMNAQEVKK